MNKLFASIGVILVALAGLLFLVTFNGGALGNNVVTGSNPTSNFLAFLFVILFLPIGSGLAFFGFAYHRPILASGTAPAYRGSSGLAKGALALAIIALIIGVGVFVVLYSTQAAQSSQLNSIGSQVSTIGNKPAVGSINSAPSVKFYRVDWSNTDPTGQDRFNPSLIVVDQGDVVQILFEHNDTDAHTFTMYVPATHYGFQINATIKGMRDFLTNLNYNSNCVNSTSASQQTTGLNANGVSTTLCVSGSSLLTPTQLNSLHATLSPISVNPNPASPLTPGNSSGNPGVVTFSIDNSVHYSVNTTNTAISSGGANATAEVFGDGAFQASIPGVFEFFCDYHVSNGMFGYLVVLPNSYCVSNAAACGVTSSTP